MEIVFNAPSLIILSSSTVRPSEISSESRLSITTWRFVAQNCIVEFKQMVTTMNGATVYASTWSTGNLGTVGSAKMSGAVRARLADMVDKFLNAYLSVNPK
jgi:hypothetical protein